MTKPDAAAIAREIYELPDGTTDEVTMNIEIVVKRALDEAVQEANTRADALAAALSKIQLKASSYYLNVSDAKANPRGINQALEYIIQTAAPKKETE